VQAGGAIIDDGGNAITIGEALQHDPALGGTADGGLTKLDIGTLTLTSTNSYTGNTIINSGKLALTGNGVITNSAGIFVATGAMLDASSRSDGQLNLVAAQTLSGSGTIIGNVLVSGAISPGAANVGAITNNGTMIFGASGSYLFDMADAAGPPGTGWDFIYISGGLSLQSANTNPFVIKLRSIDGDLTDGNPGATNFASSFSQSWIIATAAGGLANFSADKFTVDTSAFANNLAGGTFSAQAYGNSLLLVFTSRPNPPVIGGITFQGTNLIFSGTGGVPSGKYVVLTSSNLTLPFSGWNHAATNSFDDLGNFVFTNNPWSGARAQFYLLQLP
jgi:autotransporter-associated beta strand protein